MECTGYESESTVETNPWVRITLFHWHSPQGRDIHLGEPFSHHLNSLDWLYVPARMLAHPQPARSFLPHPKGTTTLFIMVKSWL